MKLVQLKIQVLLDGSCFIGYAVLKDSKDCVEEEGTTIL
jgi:hypothetical protein